MFVNGPDASRIAGLDAVSGRQVSILESAGASSNFAMAVDADEHRVMIALRNPARLVAFGTGTGERVASVETCRDAGDVFVDLRRRRIYLSCGEGGIAVFSKAGRRYAR